MSTTTTSHIAAFRNLAFIPRFSLSKSGKRSGTLTDTVPFDAEQMQDTQQHVRRLLCVVRKHNMTISFESPVDAADENHRHFHVRMPVRIPHVASLVNQDVIQDA